MKYFFTIIVSIICLLGFSKPFPKFSYKSTIGTTIDNNYLKGKKTIIVLYHLGCPAAMSLINDLNTYQNEIDTSKIQIIGILENTEQQILDFYSDSTNLWSNLREYFKMKKSYFPLIAECEKENIIIEGDNTIIDSQCRLISKKFKTKTSPTIIFTDKNGDITKKIVGYVSANDYKTRINFIAKHLGQ